MGTENISIPYIMYITHVRVQKQFSVAISSNVIRAFLYLGPYLRQVSEAILVGFCQSTVLLKDL